MYYLYNNHNFMLIYKYVPDLSYYFDYISKIVLE